MDNPMLTLPDLDDETVVKLNDFFYELLEVFESHYAYQMLRYRRDLRAYQIKNSASRISEDEAEDDDGDTVDF